MALSGLPPDILLRILEVLEHKDRLRLALVCRGFRNLVRTDFRSIRVICMPTRQSSEQAKWLQEVALKDTKVRHLQVHRKQTERLEDAKKDYRSCSPAPELKQGTWVWPDVPIPTILSFSHLEVLDLGKDSASWTLSPEDVKSFWPLLQLKMLTLRLDPWRTFSSVSRRIATYDFKDFIGFAKLQDLAIVLEYEMGSYFEACPEFARLPLLRSLTYSGYSRLRNTPAMKELWEKLENIVLDTAFIEAKAIISVPHLLTLTAKLHYGLPNEVHWFLPFMGFQRLTELHSNRPIKLETLQNGQLSQLQSLELQPPILITESLDPMWRDFYSQQEHFHYLVNLRYLTLTSYYTFVLDTASDHVTEAFLPFLNLTRLESLTLTMKYCLSSSSISGGMDKALTLDLTGLSKLDSLAKLSIRAYQRKDEDRLKQSPREGHIECNALQFCSLSPFIELGGGIELFQSLQDLDVLAHSVAAPLACSSLTRLKLGKPDRCKTPLQREIYNLKNLSGLSLDMSTLQSLHLGYMPSLKACLAVAEQFGDMPMLAEVTFVKCLLGIKGKDGQITAEEEPPCAYEILLREISKHKSLQTVQVTAINDDVKLCTDILPPVQHLTLACRSLSAWPSVFTSTRPLLYLIFCKADSSSLRLLRHHTHLQTSELLGGLESPQLSQLGLPITWAMSPELHPSDLQSPSIFCQFYHKHP